MKEPPNLPALYVTAGAPGSDGDLAAMQAEAWRQAWVAELRFRGGWMHAPLILQYHLHQGDFVTQADDTEGMGYSAHIHRPGTMVDWLPQLHAFSTVKENDNGVWLLEGLAWDRGFAERWPQTWIIAKDRADVERTVESMALWLKKRYMGQW